MKICVIIPSNLNCSANNIALRVAEGVADHDSVTVFYLKSCHSNVLSPYRCTLKKMHLIDFFSLHHYDVVHSHLLKPDLINGMFALFYKKGTTKKISTVHSNISLDLSTYFTGRFRVTLLTRLWFFSLNQLDQRVVVSKSLGNNQCGALKNYSVIHNGIAVTPMISTVISKSIKNSARIAVGILTRLHPGKGIDDAFYLAEHSTCVDVHIYGSGKLASLCKDKATQNENIFFHGFAHNLQSVFEKIDILLVTSRHEGFGMTLIESMKFCTPVICHDLPVFREILGEGDFYYKNNAELLKILPRYVENYSHIQQKQRARLPLFDEGVMIERYRDIYQPVDCLT